MRRGDRGSRRHEMTDYTTLEHDAHRAVGIKRMPGCPVCDSMRGNPRKGRQARHSRLDDMDDLGDKVAERRRRKRLERYKAGRKRKRNGETR